MPALIVYPRYSASSRLLMHTAQALGWETLRFTSTLPPDFGIRDPHIAIFSTPPLAFTIASKMNRTLVGCPAGWLIDLPAQYRFRDCEMMTVQDLQHSLNAPAFIKPALSKSFEPQVFSKPAFIKASQDLDPAMLLHVIEPVSFTIEFRCFIAHKTIRAIAPYRMNGHPLTPGFIPDIQQQEEATSFAQSILSDPAIEMPPALVLDVGWIEGRGWAVVESNECWAAGLYNCDPVEVLNVLVTGCQPKGKVEPRWDYQHSYPLCP